MTSLHQAAILKPVPAHAVHLLFRLGEIDNAADALARLLQQSSGTMVIGLGAGLCQALGIRAPKLLKPFEPPSGSRVKLPQTQRDLWVWVRSGTHDADGKAQATVLARSREICAQLTPGFALAQALPCFRHHKSHDLTGYEDGTENPAGRKALSAAIATDGSSFVALQQWRHRWSRIEAMSETQRNLAVGRVRKTNEELDDAPDSAHVKRTAQEDFTLSDGTLGFSLRRSMPWAQGLQSGLMFTSFGKNFEAFEAQLKRMSGAEDGTRDALFGMSEPISGDYYWCPPTGFLPKAGR